MRNWDRDNLCLCRDIFNLKASANNEPLKGRWVSRQKVTIYKGGEYFTSVVISYWMAITPGQAAHRLLYTILVKYHCLLLPVIIHVWWGVEYIIWKVVVQHHIRLFISQMSFSKLCLRFESYRTGINVTQLMQQLHAGCVLKIKIQIILDVPSILCFSDTPNYETRRLIHIWWINL